jgi:phosphatidylglycerol:prolipoprotein diacylglycerol transferase
MPILSYDVFVTLGFLTGMMVFFYQYQRKEDSYGHFINLFIAALIGGAIGAKLPIWIFNYKEILGHSLSIVTLLSGKTVLGGIIGGWIAVEIEKHRLGIKRKTGDIFAPALALGEAVGRIGCFLNGCCGGIPSTLPWAMDFGDGILRHPTQLYMSAFAMLLFIFLWSIKGKMKREGDLFRTYLIIYFTFRFFIEFIRTNQIFAFGLTGFQLVSVLVVLYALLLWNRLPLFNK